MIETTLCYIEKDDSFLMLHRVKKEKDENAGKWIGVGGHIETGESPEACVKRETWEETGLTLKTCRLRGIVDFYSDVWKDERMFLYTSDDFDGTLHECDEGDLKWVRKEDIFRLNLWEGDRIFLDFLKRGTPFFHLDLYYEGNDLKSWKVHPRVILASKSPRRIELLEQIGIFPEVIPSRVEEHTAEVVPEKIVEDLSKQKAEAVFQSVRDERRSMPSFSAEAVEKEKSGSGEVDWPVFIIGADTVVSLEDEVLGKPATHEAAAEMIRKLQNRTHQVYTGVTVLQLAENVKQCELKKQVTFFEKTDVRVAAMSEEEVKRYAMSDEPMDKAGGYGIQGTFAAFIEGIDGDYNTVVGLPVGQLYRVLRRLEDESEDSAK